MNNELTKIQKTLVIQSPRKGSPVVLFIRASSRGARTFLGGVVDRYLTVIDNFEPHVDGLIDMARTFDYAPFEYRGREYSGIGGVGKYFPGPQLAEALGVKHVAPVETLFRCNLYGDRPTVWIHNDFAVAGAQFAAILYLSEPGCDSDWAGTRFWRHRSTGMRRQSERLLTTEEAEQLNRQGQSDAYWAPDMEVAMKINRLIIYPVDLFHSRLPVDGFGTDPRDGRLVWVGFLRQEG